MGKDDDLERFKHRYSERLQSELGAGGESPSSSGNKTSSRDYDNFRLQYLPRTLSWYEKACRFSEKVFKISPDKKDLPRIQAAIETCHLDVTPAGVTSLALVVPLFIVLASVVFGWGIPYLVSEGDFNGLFFVVFGLIAAVSVMFPLQKLVFFMADSWRMRASNQMVLCTFYVVTYMRHTSNLELAVDFAAEHLTGPLSLDLKKVVWNIETGKYDSMKESLDAYLATWRDSNMEFVESMHLIESSLFESSETRRLNALDKSLQVMLDETYEKMLHYAHDLKSPLTTLHMLGVILPILGLVILPLMVAFMPEVKWYHLFILYNVTLPIAVFYLGKSILSKRPTGYSETDITEGNPHFRKYRSVLIKMGRSEIAINPLVFAVFVFSVLFLVGISPIIIWAASGECGDLVKGTADGKMYLGPRCTMDEEVIVEYSLLDYRDEMKKDK
jgi:hypothetical protein